MTSTFFEHGVVCPFCTATGGTCSHWLNDYKLLTLDPHALVEVPDDVFVDATMHDGTPVRLLKWKKGERITPEEAEALGFGVKTMAEMMAEEEARHGEGNREQVAGTEGRQASPPA